MSTIEWDQLFVEVDWANALNRLLAELRVACAENDGLKRSQCQIQLSDFCKNVPEEYGTLNRIALNSIEDLFIDDLTVIIAAIDRRQAELQNQISLIQSVTAEINKEERSIRFSKTLEILNQAASSIDVLVKMEKQMTEPNQHLILQIDAVSKSIQELFALAEELKAK